MKTIISFEIDTDKLNSKTDEHIATLWYVAQGNPAGMEDVDAGEVAEKIGREIINRWIKENHVPLWNHQGRHSLASRLIEVNKTIKQNKQ